jgi:hypothetical protein
MLSLVCLYRGRMSADDRRLTAAEAYEAAYRFVWQYAEREPDSESLQLLLVSMEPTDDEARTNDPAAWTDWLGCVTDVGRTDVPRYPSN